LIAEQAAILHLEEYRKDSLKISRFIDQYEQERSNQLELLKRQEQAESDRMYLEVLNWFSAAQSTAQDHEQFHNTWSQYPGSGKWILEDERVQDWMGLDIPISSLLWINGIPGAGLQHFHSF
jgi:hypothetical protein